MNDPSRLLDSSADDLERALLRAGSSHGASTALREKTLAALGVGGAAAVLGSAASLSTAPSAKLGVGSLLAKLGAAKLAVLGAVTFGAALSVAVVRSAGHTPPAPQPAAAARSPERRATHEASPAPVVTPELKPPVAAESARPEGTASPEPARSAAVGVSKPLTAAEALRVELAQLDAARSKLRSGRSEEALALLDAYGRASPRGTLKLEAEVLRIDALSRSGRTALAKSRAQTFLQKYPKSGLAARVRRVAGL